MTRSPLPLLAFAAALGGAAACDPVHSNAVASLGGEAPGVPNGPTHRPGQPCLLCHDGKLGSPAEFSVAGTVFVDPNDTSPSNGASGAEVRMTDSTGVTYTAATNRVGNFYVTSGEWRPSYPMRVEIAFQGMTTRMTSHIGRDGSCAGCHKSPVGWDSPGPVALSWPDGGVP